MHQSLQGAAFHIEHIIPRSVSGKDSLENLALACPSCNLNKSNRTEAIDIEADATVALFHPRAMNWREHFQFQRFEIVGQTAIGRATCAALKFNQPRRIKIRQAEAIFKLFPPTD
jgi:CRISPR/Cas system Type II protein with McrA/HNH and RuvC-like nuclease domain